MKTTEYIKALEALVALHGDLEVETGQIWGRDTAPIPEIAFKRVLTGRESKPDFWSEYSSKAETNKGEEVIRV